MWASKPEGNKIKRESQTPPPKKKNGHTKFETNTNRTNC